MSTKVLRYPQYYICILTSIFLLCLPATVLAADFFVSPTGNDEVTCTQAEDINRPKRTVASALPCVAGGGTIFLRALSESSRTYGGFRTNKMKGSRERPITIKSYPPDKLRARIDVSLRNIIIYSSEYITIEDLEITNTDYLANEDGNWHCSAKDTACQIAAQTEDNCFLNDPNCQAYVSRLMSSPSGITLASDPNANAPSKHLVLRNLEIHHMYGIGVAGGSLRGGDERSGDILLENNDFHHLGVRGIQGAYCTYINSVDTILRGNTCRHSSGSDGFRGGYSGPKYSPERWVVENNISFDNGGRYYRPSTKRIFDGGSGITIIGRGTGGILRNNISYNNRRTGMSVGLDYKVYNNTTFGNGTNGIFTFWGDRSTYINNLSYGNPHDFYIVAGTNPSFGPNMFGKPATSQDGSSGSDLGGNVIVKDPLFINAAAGDFRLRSGSPAIDAGVSLADVPTDFDGNQRRAGSGWDMGAYEYPTGGSPSDTTAPGSPTNLRLE